MARPIKRSVDYFSHDCEHGKTLFVIETQFGNDGYAFWFKLLETIGRTEGHCYNFNNPSAKVFLLSKTHVSEETANKILSMLADMEAIDTELWKQGYIWCQNFVDRLTDVYIRRKVEKPLKPTLTIDEQGKCKHKLSNINQSDAGNPQTKLNKTKLNKTIFVETSDEVRLSQFLLEKIRTNNPGYKEPNIQDWALHINRMIRIDKRTVTEIQKVIEWCQTDNFWQSNILSTRSLRDKYDALNTKRLTGGTNGQGQGFRTNSVSNGGLGVPPEYIPSKQPEVSDEARERIKAKLKEFSQATFTEDKV